MKLSIIIPIYNIACFLENCLNSIMSQIEDGYESQAEIILVDDGSTDDSAQICESFSVRYSCIRYVSSKNYGVSHARNVGIAVATGDYVTFADSDDWYSPNAIKTMFDLISISPDCAITGTAEEYYDSVQHIRSRELAGNTFERISLREFANRFEYFNNHFNLASPWNKLYRRELINRNNISFKEDMREYEDSEFNFRYFLTCSTISFSESVTYHWRRIIDLEQPKRLYLTKYRDCHCLAATFYRFAKASNMDGASLLELQTKMLDMYCDTFRLFRLLRGKYRRNEIVGVIKQLYDDSVLETFIVDQIPCPRKLKIIVCLSKLKLFNLLYYFIVFIF